MKLVTVLILMVLPLRSADASVWGDWTPVQNQWFDDHFRPGPGSRGRSSRKPAKATSTRVALRAPKGPAQLAARAPAGQRAMLVDAYTKLLAAHGQLETAAKIPAGDVAGSLASYIAGAYVAYRGGEVGDVAFLALVAQCRDILAGAKGFAGASLAAKQDLYEHTAILGMMMMAARASAGADIAAISDGGKRILEALFGVSADKIAIDDKGFHLAK